MAAEDERKPIDLPLERTNRLERAFYDLTDQLKQTNTLIGRGFRDMGENLDRLNDRLSILDRAVQELQRDVRELRSDQVLYFNQVLTAQERTLNVDLRLREIEGASRPGAP